MADQPQVSDDQLKAAIGGGLLAWIVLPVAGVPALGGVGAVVAAVAGIMLFMRKQA